MRRRSKIKQSHCKSAILCNYYVCCNELKYNSVQVLNAYKQASAALKSTLAETGLSEDAVSSTMDDVEEVCNLQTFNFCKPNISLAGA